MDNSALKDAARKELMRRAAMKELERRNATPSMGDISAALPDVAVNRAQREYNALPGWAKPLVAAQDVADLAMSGVTLGFSDKALALADSVLGRGGYDERLAERQRQSGDAKARAGAAGTVAEIGGTLIPATALVRSGLSATRMVPASLSGAKGLAARSVALGLDGATLGGIQALGSDEDVGTGAAIGFAGGLGGNMLGEAIGAGAGKVAGLFNAKPPQMTTEQLQAAGAGAYKQAKDAGVIFRPESVDRLRQSVYDDMAQMGFDPVLHPGAAVVYNRLERLVEGGYTGLDGLETVRRVASAGFNPQNPANNEMLRRISGRIDDFAASAGPDDIISGDVSRASEALTNARDYWSRFRKLEKVQELLDRAERRAASTGSGGNIENATRQELRKILDNKKMMRGFTDDEKAAIRTAVLGSGTQNTLRLLGKLSPQGNGLMAMLGLGGVATMPQFAIPAMLLGAGAKKGAEAITARNAEAVKRLIAAGGNRASLIGQPNAAQRLIEQYQPLLGRAIMSGALVGAAGR